MVAPFVPDRGDIIWLDFDPQAGREQAGRRPAYVVSPKSYNERARLMLVCPVTSKSKGYPFEVELPVELLTKGVVLVDQVKSVDVSVRLQGFIESVPSGFVNDVKKLLLRLIE